MRVDTILEIIKAIKPFLEEIVERLRRAEKKFVEVNKDGAEVLRRAYDAFQALQESVEKGKIPSELIESLNLNKVKSLLENTIIITTTSGEIFIADHRMSIDEVKERIKAHKVRDIEEEKFFISTWGTSLEYEEIKREPKVVEKEISEIISLLPFEIREKFESLIVCALEIERFYKMGEIKRAENIRRSVLRSYGSFGLKFCNLYQRNYLRKFLGSLVGTRKLIMEKIDKFFEDANNIFFIYIPTEIWELEKIKDDIIAAFNNEEDYIAIHSLGGAVDIAEYIVRTLKEEIGEIPPRYNHRRELGMKEGIKDLTEVWYKGEKGEYFLKLLSDP